MKPTLLHAMMAAAFVASRFHGDAQQLTAAPDKVVMCQITPAALT